MWQQVDSATMDDIGLEDEGDFRSPGLPNYLALNLTDTSFYSHNRWFRVAVSAVNHAGLESTQSTGFIVGVDATAPLIASADATASVTVSNAVGVSITFQVRGA